MSRLVKKEKVVLDAQAEDGFGTALKVGDYNHIVLEVATDNSANLTVQFQGSLANEAPDFTAAQSASNPWDYIALKDLENQATVEGDEGISYSGTDDVRLLEVNINGLQHLNAEVSSHSAGDVTVKANLYTNA